MGNNPSSIAINTSNEERALYVKSNSVGFFVLVVVLLVSGCRMQERAEPSDGARVCRMRQRECTTNDAPYAEMTWKAFRPFSVSVPPDIEVKCCCMDEGQMEMVVPGIAIPVVVRVLDRFSDAISGLIEYYRSPPGDAKGIDGRFDDDDWFMEKKYSDRRMMMDLRVSSSDERLLRCFCELDSGERLLFLADLSSKVDDSTCEQIWRLCHNFKFKNNCLDAFNCNVNASLLVADVPPLARLAWKESELDIGECEWKSLRQIQVFAPSSVGIESCGIDDEHFVFDLPGKRHYVTACYFGEDPGMIDEQLAIYIWSSTALKGVKSSDERLKMQYVLRLRQLAGIDWYMDNQFADRRLVVEHRRQSEECEGLACYCIFAEGLSMRFRVRGGGVISDSEIDYFLRLCKVIKVREAPTTPTATRWR